MKKEINFYEVDEGVVKAMGPVLLKILDEKKRAFIYYKFTTLLLRFYCDFTCRFY